MDRGSVGAWAARRAGLDAERALVVPFLGGESFIATQLRGIAASATAMRRNVPALQRKCTRAMQRTLAAAAISP
jgi:hypothetical protein